MRGETGPANSAPRQLADHLGLHYVHDVQEIMDSLARNRAKACLDALVALGVPESQLTVAFKGRGGALKVDFVPQDVEGDGEGRSGGSGGGAGMDLAAARAEMSRAKEELAPLPAGIPYEVRLKKGGSVIVAGMTESEEPEVFCQLPHRERLIVGQTYIFEAFPGPGTEPNACEFTIDPSAVLERDILEVRLPVRRAASGVIEVITEHAVPEGHWSRELPLPLSIPYQVVDHTGAVAVSGLVANGKSATLNSYGLVVGQAYTVRVPETKVIRSVEAARPIVMGREEGDPIALRISRQTAPVDLVVRAANKERDDEHWSAQLPLPALFDVLVVHKGLFEQGKPSVVSEFLVEGETGPRARRVLDRAQLFVGETYLVQIGSSVHVQTNKAAEKLAALMKDRAIHFNGAGEERLPAISQAWSVAYHGDVRKAEQNSLILSEVAKVMHAFPGCCWRLSARSGSARVAPAGLAAHYKLDQKRDALMCMMHLARNRAHAIIEALGKLGVPSSRLKPSFAKVNSGKPPRTEFIARPLEGLMAMGFEPAVREFKVVPESRVAQQIDVPLLRATADLVVRLVNARAAHSGHWSAVLAVASGVPVTIKHKGLGLRVLHATVYDGEVHLPGADIFYVGETYVVEVPETIRTLPATAEVVILPGMRVGGGEDGRGGKRSATICTVPIERPARRIQLQLFSERQSGDKERQLAEARRAMTDFMLKNKVYFNGAAEAVTQSSPLGTAQAWSIEHLDGASKGANQRTLDGVAHIMIKNPDVSLEIRGETTKHTKADKLGEYFRLHPSDDIRQIMDLLARRRGEACYEALKNRGIDPARMFVTSHPLGENMKVDFIPHGSQIANQYDPLPVGVPFRLLHQRHTDYGLAEAMRRMRLFMDEHEVRFNGAGEQLPRVEQAWDVMHLDPITSHANHETLEGVARIMLDNDQCALEIHGETGAADAAPRQLAAYLDMNRMTQVKEIMDRLAEYRAQACLEKLVEMGVPRARLFVTYNGLGTHIRVNFLPRSMRPYAPTADEDTDDHSYSSGGGGGWRRQRRLRPRVGGRHNGPRHQGALPAPRQRRPLRGRDLRAAGDAAGHRGRADPIPRQEPHPARGRPVLRLQLCALPAPRRVGTRPDLRGQPRGQAGAPRQHQAECVRCGAAGRGLGVAAAAPPQHRLQHPPPHRAQGRTAGAPCVQGGRRSVVRGRYIRLPLWRRERVRHLRLLSAL